MKRRLFVALLIVIGISAVGFWYLGSKVDESVNPLDNVLGTSSFLPESVTKLFSKASDGAAKLDTEATTNQVAEQFNSTAEQLKETSERSLEVAKHAGNVLGTAVTATNSAPLHERALEYAQYTYCKQAVAEYEKLNGIVE